MSDDIFNLDVSEDLELENFKAFCEVESGIPAPQILVVLEGRPLTDDKKSLKVVANYYWNWSIKEGLKEFKLELICIEWFRILELRMEMS